LILALGHFSILFLKTTSKKNHHHPKKTSLTDLLNVHQRSIFWREEIGVLSIAQ